MVRQLSLRLQILTKNSLQWLYPQNYLPRYLSTACSKHTDKSGSRHVQPVFVKALDYLSSTALVDQNASLSYADLLCLSFKLSRKIAEYLPLSQENHRISMLCDNDSSYVIVQWATWWLRKIVVPLCPAHPIAELEYFVTNSRSSLIIGTDNHGDKVRSLSNVSKIPFLHLDKEDYITDKSATDLNNLSNDIDSWKSNGLSNDDNPTNSFRNHPAMIVYTSGTTGQPKGVVVTHGNLHSQITSMVECWEWTSNYVMLHCLPLHHIHGIVNALMTPLYCGALCIMLPKFDPKQVWSNLVKPVDFYVGRRAVNVFTAVPTMYSKLLEYYYKEYAHSDTMREFIKATCSHRIRLMMSGSAPLPDTVMTQWRDVTGHTLLERYGMTEIGMALSNPLHGNRRPGCVGLPMPGVHVQIASPNVYAINNYDVIAKADNRRVTVTKGKEGESGELLVKSGSVFGGYWDNTGATTAAFTSDGWFKTGDTAVINKEGVVQLLGRTSVDVIKSGGYKISALEIERHLLEHPCVKECAVVGVPDITWGQKVAAIVVVKKRHQRVDRDGLKIWLGERIAAYKIPSVVKCVDAIPRNVMGKINKKQLVAGVF